MATRAAVLLAVALFGTASAFAPAALPMGLRQRSATAKISGLRMGGADPTPPGPEGRGPFDQNDAFVLPDGRVYVPGDACTDDLYDEAIKAPVIIGDEKKQLVLGAGFLGFSILVPTFLIKVVMGM